VVKIVPRSKITGFKMKKS